MSKTFKNHNFNNATAEQSHFARCAYCEQTLIDCSDKNTGMLGECPVGKHPTFTFTTAHLPICNNCNKKIIPG